MHGFFRRNSVYTYKLQIKIKNDYNLPKLVYLKTITIKILEIITYNYGYSKFKF